MIFQSGSNMENIYKSYLGKIEDGLDKYFRRRAPHKKLLEAMRYSLLAGGKRIRPVLLLEFCRVSGGDIDKAMPMACAVEMLHTYSLIHDDLPCMDDDDLRRGLPTNHVVYGEATAVLAGDALQAAAFEAVLSCDIPADRANSAGQILARAAGESGICGGQLLDMEGEGKTLTEKDVGEIHSRKTAALISAAVLMGCAAGGADREQTDAAREYAENLGLAFQIRDDILDCEGSEDSLGKPIGSDISREKSTYVSIFGLDTCEKMLREKTSLAKNALKGNFSDTGFLDWLADWLALRHR